MPLKNPSLANSSPIVRIEPLFGREGLTWIQQQLGNPYVKEDILNQVLRLMGFKFYIGEPKHYDCSDLTSDYLVHANTAWILGPHQDGLHMVMPNDLASILRLCFAVK